MSAMRVTQDQVHGNFVKAKVSRQKLERRAVSLAARVFNLVFSIVHKDAGLFSANTARKQLSVCEHQLGSTPSSVLQPDPFLCVALRVGRDGKVKGISVDDVDGVYAVTLVRASSLPGDARGDTGTLGVDVFSKGIGCFQNAPFLVQVSNGSITCQCKVHHRAGQTCWMVYTVAYTIYRDCSVHAPAITTVEGNRWAEELFRTKLFASSMDLASRVCRVQRALSTGSERGGDDCGSGGPDGSGEGQAGMVDGDDESAGLAWELDLDSHRGTARSAVAPSALRATATNLGHVATALQDIQSVLTSAVHSTVQGRAALCGPTGAGLYGTLVPTDTADQIGRHISKEALSALLQGFARKNGQEVLEEVFHTAAAPGGAGVSTGGDDASAGRGGGASVVGSASGGATGSDRGASAGGGARGGISGGAIAGVGAGDGEGAGSRAALGGRATAGAGAAAGGRAITGGGAAAADADNAACAGGGSMVIQVCGSSGASAGTQAAVATAVLSIRGSEKLTSSVRCSLTLKCSAFRHGRTAPMCWRCDLAGR